MKIKENITEIAKYQLKQNAQDSFEIFTELIKEYKLLLQSKGEYSPFICNNLKLSWYEKYFFERELCMTSCHSQKVKNLCQTIAELEAAHSETLLNEFSALDFSIFSSVLEDGSEKDIYTLTLLLKDIFFNMLNCFANDLLDFSYLKNLNYSVDYQTLAVNKSGVEIACYEPLAGIFILTDDLADDVDQFFLRFYVKPILDFLDDFVCWFDKMDDICLSSKNIFEICNSCKDL